MLLFGIKPDGPDFELHSFECAKCQHIEIVRANSDAFMEVVMSRRDALLHSRPLLKSGKASRTSFTTKPCAAKRNRPPRQRLRILLGRAD